MSFKHHVFSFAVILLIQPTADAVYIKSEDNNYINKVNWFPWLYRTQRPNVTANPPCSPHDRPKGDVGPAGPVGPKGEQGDRGSDGIDLRMRSNWKQCAWKHSDTKDNGLIQNCDFNKRHDNTSLRVFYGGNLRINNCDSCCKRWYFTFGGAECSKPMAIDGVFFMWKGVGTQNIHRHRHIEGYCNQVPKGLVQVGFSVGNCAGYGDADAFTGWNSVSRIVIEEVPPPQP